MNIGEEDNGHVDWSVWKTFLDERRERPLPALDLRTDYSGMPESLARSLAVFQVDEHGGSTIVDRMVPNGLYAIDDHRISAIQLLAAEERRHANILAMCVRLLGGELLQKSRCSRWITMAHRRKGAKFRSLMLLAAETVAIGYYSALAEQVTRGPIRQWLLQLVYDKRAHLQFHCDFLRSRTPGDWRRRLLAVMLKELQSIAGLLVLIEHRRAIRDMQLGAGLLWRRWMVCARMTEKMITDEQPLLPGARIEDAAAPTAMGQ